MIASHCLSLLTMVLLYPAPRDPEPDEKGKGFFGVQLVDNGGVLITRVEPGSPADKAGIRINDVIRAIDTADISTVEDARDIIGRLRPGRVTQVEVLRGATMVNIRVKVGGRPDSLP
jgi:S1-C subfamily serine protease